MPSDEAEIVVFQVRRRDSSCDSCGEQLGTGRQIRLLRSDDGEDQALCLPCAGLDDLGVQEYYAELERV